MNPEQHQIISELATRGYKVLEQYPAITNRYQVTFNGSSLGGSSTIEDCIAIMQSHLSVASA